MWLDLPFVRLNGSVTHRSGASGQVIVPLAEFFMLAQRTLLRSEKELNASE